MSQVCTFNGGYGRKGIIEICPGVVCDKCGEVNTTCLTMDGSDGEYGSGCICFACILVAFEAFEELKKIK
jgi:hypothetical protein